MYVGFGGLYGDCGPYRGSVVGVPASGRGPLISYLVPTAREGGIWGAGGLPVGRGGTLYAGVGNGAATGGAYDDSDSVTALSPGLHRTGIFAPAVWAADNANDLDLGSLSPVLLPSGLVLSVGKRGVGYLLNGARLGGVGGQLAQGPVCPAFGGAAVRGTVAYVPCASGGMAAVDTAGRASGCCGAGRRRRPARRSSAAARSGSPTGTLATSTGSTRPPGTSASGSPSARRSRISPRPRCPGRSR